MHVASWFETAQVRLLTMRGVRQLEMLLIWLTV